MDERRPTALGTVILFVGVVLLAGPTASLLTVPFDGSPTDGDARDSPSDRTHRPTDDPSDHERRSQESNRPFVAEASETVTDTGTVIDVRVSAPPRH